MSSTDFTLEKRELVRHDPTTGRTRSSPPRFTPRVANEPLKVEGYEFSGDASKLLIFTNSQRVWRRNTRGDYWVLDVKGQTPRKLDGDVASSSLMFATTRRTARARRPSHADKRRAWKREILGEEIRAALRSGADEGEIHATAERLLDLAA